MPASMLIVGAKKWGMRIFASCAAHQFRKRITDLTTCHVGFFGTVFLSAKAIFTMCYLSFQCDGTDGVGSMFPAQVVPTVGKLVAAPFPRGVRHKTPTSSSPPLTSACFC